MQKTLLALGLGTALSALSLGAMAQDRVNLVYWSLWNEPEPGANVMKSLIADFEAAHPGLTIAPVWNGRQNQTTVRNALAGGTQIDIMDSDMEGLKGGLASAGALLPWDAELAAPAPGGEAGTFGDLFYPHLLDMASNDGALYQIPYMLYAYNIFYSQGALEKAGVSALPEDWDGFVAALEQVKASGLNGIAVESDIAFYNIKWFNYLIERVAGPDFLMRATEDKTGETWRDPAVLKAVELELDLWARGLIPAESRGYQWPAGQQTIAFDETAVELVGSWLPVELADTVEDDFKWGAIRFPSVEGGLGDVNHVEINAHSMAILASSTHEAEAREFIKFIASTPSQQRYATDAKIGVANRNVEWAPEVAAARKSLDEATLILSENHGIKAKYPDYSTNVYEALHNQVFLGSITPAEFVDQMVARTKEFWANRS